MNKTKNSQKDVLYIFRRQVNFPDGFWQPSWSYADYESCPKFCQRMDFKSTKKVHRKEQL